MTLLRLIRPGKKSKYAYKPVSTSFQPDAKFQPVTITYQLDPASKEALKAKSTPKPQPKNDNHAAAFVFGLVVSGVASAATVLWKTPRSGAKTREMIADRTEATLFQLMGMDDYVTGEKTPTAVQTPAPAFAPDERGASPSPFDDTQPITTLDDDGGSLPPTYRGEVLTEVPTATSASASSTAPSTPSTPTDVGTSLHGSNNR